MDKRLASMILDASCIVFTLISVVVIATKQPWVGLSLLAFITIMSAMIVGAKSEGKGNE